MCNQGILDPYFYLANHLGFANNMFQTNQGPSFPAHQFLLSGTSAPLGYSSSNPPMCSDGTNSWACYKWFDAENGNLSLTGCIGDQIPQESLAYSIAPLTGSDSDEAHVYTPGYPVNQFAGFPCYEHATLTDLLDNASPSISWRYYARSVGNLWTAPAAIQHMCLPSGYGGYCTGYDFTGGGNPLPPKVELPTYKPADNSGDAAPILTEIQNCALPTVSWVIPDGNWSDHAGGVWTTEKGDGGPSWVSAIVNQVAQATNCDTNNAHPGYWYDTVILVTWDDWGGYYDHVVPPDCATSPCTGYPNGTGFQYVYGFRVPLLVVGAYVNQTGNPGGAYTGYISNQNHDFGSILNFIEYAFGTGGTPVGGTYGIGGVNYPYADHFAPDVKPQGPDLYGLQDFFNFNQTPLSPPAVPQGLYPPSCFHKPKPGNGTCFDSSEYPIDPDNDANETD